MTLDESIKHAEEVAVEHTKYNRYGGFESCDECAKEHLQLARWLKELKQLREQTNWTPVSEGLPKERKTYLISLKGIGELEGIDNELGFGLFIDPDLKNHGWIYFGVDDPSEKEVVAWMPLPKSYKEVGGNENDI